MKNVTRLFSIFLLLAFGQTKAQYIFNVTPPTCPTCCDGTIIVTQTFCYAGATLGGFDPPLTLVTYTFPTTFLYVGACCQTYTMYLHSSWKECINGTITGTVEVCPLTTSITNYTINSTESRLFPNPTAGKCFIDLKGHKTMIVTDLYGKIVQTTRTEEDEIDLFGLSPGIYFITISSDENGVSARQKIILE